MFRTLRTKLLLNFVIISLIGIGFVSLTIFLGFKEIFKDYLEQKRLQQISRVISLLKTEYQHNGKLTGITVNLVMEQQALRENIFYSIYDVNNHYIIGTTHLIRPSGFRTSSGPDPSMPKLLSETHLLDIEERFNPLDKNQGLNPDLYKNIGSIKVFYPENYARTDFIFLNQFTKYILLTAVSMISLAILLSYLVSNNLTFGLRQIKLAAQELRLHNFTIRIPTENQLEEMKQLALAFNELAEHLLNQKKLRKQFSNDIAHELRTPLATLRSQIEAYQDGIWEPTPERLKQSHHELMRLVRLVTDLEKLLEAENPQMVLNIEKLEANQLVQTLKDQFLPISYEKKIEIQIKQTMQNLWFEADLERVQQILTNLLYNSLKYTPIDGYVSITVSSDSEYVHFTIEDTGEGISSEDLPYVFERFYRGDKSRNRKTGGVGIGLAIVKALVDAHKGKIAIKSELSKGTIVTVSFPLAFNKDVILKRQNNRDTNSFFNSQVS